MHKKNVEITGSAALNTAAIPTGEQMGAEDVYKRQHSQLAKENKKFIYSVLREGARAKDFELAIQWLIDCGLCCKVGRVTKGAEMCIRDRSWATPSV